METSIKSAFNIKKPPFLGGGLRSGRDLLIRPYLFDYESNRYGFFFVTDEIRHDYEKN